MRICKERARKTAKVNSLQQNKAFSTPAATAEKFCKAEIRTPRKRRGVLHKIKFDSLDAAGYLAGTEAPRANVHLSRFPVNDNMHALDVRRPAALGLAVGVADQIAGHDTLVADFTVLTHASSPPP